jgi:hypothetical protein
MLTGVPALAAVTSARPARTAATQISLNEDGATVKTANGQSWTMTVADTNAAYSLQVSLLRPVTAGGTGSEEHDWGFPTAAGTLKFTPSTGVGTVKGGTGTGSVASIDLTFKATAHRAGACSSGSETIYTGTLSGEAKLVTGLTGGGTVGGTSVAFNAKGTTPTVFVDSGCVPVVNTCFASTILVSGGNASAPAAEGYGEVVAGKKDSQVSVVHQVLLSAPSGAFRDDEGVVDTPYPTWNATTKTVSVTTTSAGIVTGSATLTGGSPKKTSSSCSFAGKSYTLTSTTDETANYASPAGKAITAHTSLSGNLVAPNSKGTGYYEVTTVAAK